MKQEQEKEKETPQQLLLKKRRTEFNLDKNFEKNIFKNKMISFYQGKQTQYSDEED